MKWLFGLILLLNVLVAVWFGLLSGEDDSELVKRSQPANSGSIVLLAEREEAKPSAPEAFAHIASTDSQCYSLGPFKSTEEATGAVMQLKAQGWLSVARKSEDRVPKGYWVYIPPAKDKNAAKKTLRDMHAANVDSFLITKGPNTNAISVGIYSDLKYAEERRAELASKGFDIKLEERFTNKTLFWVDLTAEGALRMTEEVRRKLMIDFRGAELREGQCGEKIATAQ